MNKVRADPKSLIPDLKYMLCFEYNPVPSPGGAYDTANNLCSAISGALWKFIGPIIGKGQTAQEFCDSTIRKILRIPAAPEPTCKRPNMGDNKIYTMPNGQRMMTNEGRAAIEDAIAFLKV